MIDYIIVNYNSTKYLLKCLESISMDDSGYTKGIIVADNCSRDNPRGTLINYPNVKLISNNNNIGFGKAINDAVRRSCAKYLVILNPDTIIEKGFLKKIIGFIEHNPGIGLLGPQILELDGKIQGSARRFPTFWTSIFGRRSPLTKLFPENSITKREFPCFDDNVTDVDWVSGACMVTKKEVFESVGGFDERFFLYWEDADLCKKMKDAGWRIVYYPEAKVVHAVGRSSDSKPLHSIYYFHHSCYKLFLKYTQPPTSLLNPIVFLGLFLRCLFVIMYNVSARKLLAKKKRTKRNTELEEPKISVAK
jgi:GT2 family glycosyltransferase